ncbi:MAG: S-formylglutathione hydrolase [Woeseia sp.]
METLSEHAAFDGTVGFYKHAADTTSCDMRFSVFVPPQAKHGKVPVLTFLSGLSCTEETFMMKSGAQRVAAELGLMLIAPDTSPRGDGVPDDPHSQYDFGLGAGFYLNATKTPWNHHYHMYDYVTRELNELLFANFPADRERHGITGHSMGGHGALTLGLRNPDLYRSISAFAPICSTLNSPWGHKALSYYLGEDRSSWGDYDAVEVAKNLHEVPAEKILIDQGLADQFLDKQLNPDLFEAACTARGIKLKLRRHKGYDHGYYFIATFIEDHLRHHARILTR